MEGWISIHRTLQNHFLWEDKPFSKGQAWIDLLLLVNHSDNKIMIGNEVINVERGSHITSEIKLMKRWGWSKSKVRNFLLLLENDSMIVKKTDSKKTTLTICNYDVWQDMKTAKRPEKDCKKTAKRLQKDTNNNDNNENNDNNDNNKENTYVKKITDFFNEQCNSFPKILKITDKRKKAIKSRIKEHGIETILEVLEKANNSDFLTGKKTDWKAGFDWIMNPSNFVKIYEGNYDNKEKEHKTNDNDNGYTGLWL